MKRAQFVRDRRKDWLRFESLLGQGRRKRFRGLDGEDVSEYSRLFRAICYDLATVRSRDWGSDLERYLNDLVGRGHNSFYRSPPGRPREVLRFLTVGFPRLLREHIAYFWAALALFLLPGLIAGVVVGRSPETAHFVLPADVLEMFDEMYSEAGPMATGDGGESEGDSTGEDILEEGFGTGGEAAMTGFYVYNNVGIAFRCFATGIFFGVGTVFFLIYNSIFIGTLTGYVVAAGHSERFFSFVVSHGSFELTAIVISGAAGLVIGHALLRPGELSRLDALKTRGLVGVKLAAGAGAMLLVAALIEAFWSPSIAPPWAKFTVGGFLWLCVIAYLGLAGRWEESP